MRRTTCAVTCLLAGVLTSALAAQAGFFRVDTETVFLTVTTAEAGQPRPTALSRDDFRVFEDGVLQDISVFSSEPQPIALSLLLDSSTSMEQKMAVAQQAAVGFCRRLGPEDVAQIISFNSETEVRQEFTRDQLELEQAIRSIRARGSTSLYTAIYIALDELRRVRAEMSNVIRRQAIVVLSDGEDTTSLLPFDDVLESAKRSNVTVYTIRLRDQRAPAVRSYDGSEFALRSLSQVTGGRNFTVESIAELPAIYEQISVELANQYLIGYTSTNEKRDGAWRQIAVHVGRANTSARTRAGYFGPKPAR